MVTFSDSNHDYIVTQATSHAFFHQINHSELCPCNVQSSFPSAHTHYFLSIISFPTGSLPNLTTLNPTQVIITHHGLLPLPGSQSGSAPSDRDSQSSRGHVSDTHRDVGNENRGRMIIDEVTGPLPGVHDLLLWVK